MTITAISANTIGSGAQFTFAASGDSLLILANATMGSTVSSVFSIGLTTDVDITFWAICFRPG